MADEVAKRFNNRNDVCAPYKGAVLGASVDIDTVDLTQPTRGISVDVVGTVKVTMLDGQVISFVSGAFVVGTIYPICISRLWTTGTAATGILLYW